MKVLKKVIKYPYSKLYERRRWGVEYAAKKISNCHSRYIAKLLKKYNASIGEDVNFKDKIQLDNFIGDQDAKNDFSNLTIGNNCYIGKGVFFDLPDKITIGHECAVSAGVKFITHADCGDRIMSKWYPRQTGQIVIGYGSWIGVNAVILHGVLLGHCCVVGAGSVVTKSFPPYSVIVGNPARFVKRLKPKISK